jgi:nicotinate-nucleotide pyrophosphorylase (carboxylating)
VVVTASMTATAFPPIVRLLEPTEVERLVHAALAEDLGAGDRTSESVVDGAATATAAVLLKEPGVVCGLSVVAAVFRAVDPDVRLVARATDGDRIEDVPFELARIEGNARALLAAERTALNLLGRLSGIATLTRRYVDAVAGTGAEILDTRKTTPGLRALEKHAVRCGGGRNHRSGLDDAVLIKDNHLRLAGSLAGAVERARQTGLAVEVECETLDQVREALDAGADAILLDNMAPPTLREAVSVVRGRAPLEASGGVTLDTVRAIAETGVDFVSVGALTHSARSLDVSLEVR